MDSLIGPDTVNTMPDDTVEAFSDHGEVSRTIDDGIAEAHAVLEELATVGVDLADVAEHSGRRRGGFVRQVVRRAAPVPGGQAVEVEELSADALLSRLMERDASLWPSGNVSPTRLGWLDSHERYRAQLGELQSFADSLDAQRVVLLGMGGSSLGPLVISRWSEGRPLEVLDTTAPDEIARATDDLSDAFILVSSKSGTTLEVESLLAHCWSKLPDPSRYAVVTDPGSALLKGRLADARHFVNDPDIGGRYSVLSLFGLVPAALTGADTQSLLDGAAEADLAEASEMGVQMASAAAEGRDKLTIVGPHEFGLWAEQLIAESTGKQGKGIVPVPVGDESEGGADRQHVEVSIGSMQDLGREFRPLDGGHRRGGKPVGHRPVRRARRGRRQEGDQPGPRFPAPSHGGLSALRRPCRLVGRTGRARATTSASRPTCPSVIRPNSRTSAVARGMCSGARR